MRRILGGIYLIAITFFPFVYFFVIQKKFVIDEETISKIEKQFTLISWAVTSITSILAFGVLYLTLLLEKKVFNNIKRTKEFYKPYHINKKEIKNYIYGSSNSKGKLGLLYFFIVFSLSTLLINLFWVTAIGNYSNYNTFSLTKLLPFKWLGDINTMSDILVLFIPLTFWIIVTAINVFIYGILIESSFLYEIKIPNEKERLDINFLKSQNADLSELLFKVGPLLTIYNKYDSGMKSIDLYIEQEIPWKNYCAVFKFYEEDKIKYKLYYRAGESDSENTKPISICLDLVGGEEFLRYLSVDKNIADVSFYTLKGEEISSFKVSLEIIKDYKVFVPFRKVLHPQRNIEQGRLRNMIKEFDLEKIDN